MQPKETLATVETPAVAHSAKLGGSSDQAGHFRCRLVSLIVGGVLLAAAGLKLHGGPEAVWGDGFIPPAVRLVTLQAELLVGAWLVAGWARRTAWLTALLLFCGFAAVSAAMGATGQNDCGCFGRTHVSPWVAFALDAACVGLLLLARPLGWGAGGVRSSAAAVGGFVLLGLLAVVWASSPAGQSALERALDEKVILASPIVDVGDAPEGAVREAHFELVNRSADDIQIVGGKMTCSCMSPNGLRFTIPAGGMAIFKINVTYK